MGVIEAEFDRFGACPLPQDPNRPWPQELLLGAKAPFEDVDSAFRVLPGQGKKEFPQCFTEALGGFEQDARVEIPADDQNPVMRGGHCVTDEMVVVGGIDNSRCPLAAFNPPTVPARYENRRSEEHTSELQPL